MFLKAVQASENGQSKLMHKQYDDYLIVALLYHLLYTGPCFRRKSFI